MIQKDNYMFVCADEYGKLTPMIPYVDENLNDVNIYSDQKGQYISDYKVAEKYVLKNLMSKYSKIVVTKVVDVLHAYLISAYEEQGTHV